MNDVHALIGPLLLLVLVVLAIAATGAALMSRAPGALEAIRRAVLVVIVAEAAIGLALAVRGGSPNEGIHWLYGGAIVLALLVPGMLEPDLPASRRSAALALGSSFAVIMAWRLGASG